MSAFLNHAFPRYLSTTLARTAKEKGPFAVSVRPEGGYKIWRNLAIMVAFPSIFLCALNCVPSYQSHPHERPEFKKYDYLRVRTKRFPWGDGDRSLFHNPKTNALLDGYEDQH